MDRVCFIVEEIKLIEDINYDSENDGYGSLSGQIMSSFCVACTETFIGSEPRLVEGMLLCEITIDTGFIG